MDQYRRESRKRNYAVIPAATWWLVMLGVCLGSVCAEVPTPVMVEPSVKPTDGGNLAIIDSLEDGHRLIVGTTNPVHNWFMGAFQGLKTDADTVVVLSLAGNDAGGNQASVAKWAGNPGLMPLFTYGDPERYETYEWYVKDPQGRWSSGDPFRGGGKKYFGTGEVPEQTVVPAAVAAQFLVTTAGKTYWSPWREVDRTEAVPTLNIFRMTHRFVSQATLALHTPYTYTYLQAFIERLQAAKLPGVFVDDVGTGTTPEGRKLQVIRLEDPVLLQKPSDHPTICLIAREHATEAASSWALQGALNALLSDLPQSAALRRGRTWLCIHIEDPDGSAHSTFDQLTDRFYRAKNPPTPSEVTSYARYFTDYIAAGQSIDAVASLHCIEATEFPAHVFCPFRDIAFQDEIIEFNKAFFSRLQQEGYLSESPDKCWNTGAMTFRLFGWLADRFGAFDLCYELNDRYPQQRLSLAQLQGIGNVLAEVLAKWTDSPEGQEYHRSVNERLTKHREARTQYLNNKPGGDGERSPHELLTLGF